MTSEEKFYDSICLFEKKVMNTCYPLELEPSDYNFENKFQDLITNVFPPAIPDEESLIYTFTIANKYCHTYKFRHEDICYAITIITSLDYHTVFQAYLENMKQIYDKPDYDMDPYKLYYHIINNLNEWKFIDKNTMYVDFFNDEFEQNIEKSVENLVNFNPFLYLPPDIDYTPLWAALVAHRRVYIYCPNPCLLSRATLSMTSFFTPFTYFGKMLISLNPCDKRASTEDYDIIGTTDASQCNTPDKPGVVLEVARERSLIDINDEYEAYKQRGRLFSRVAIHILRHRIADDPYFILTDKNPFQGEINQYIKPRTAEKIPPLWSIVEFGDSPTFKAIINDTCYIGEFRESIINMNKDHFYGLKIEEQLDEILQIMKKAFDLFSHDIHFISVLKLHKKFIRKLKEKKFPKIEQNVEQ